MKQIITRKTTGSEFMEILDQYGKSFIEVSEKSGVSISTIRTVRINGFENAQSPTIYNLNAYFNSLEES